MTKYAAALVIFCALCVGSFSVSGQPGIQTKRGELTKNYRTENQPTPQRFPTEQEITKSIANGITAANEKRDAAYPPPKNEKTFWDFLLFAFNGILVVVGVAQCYLIFHTLKATKAAANAAQKAADVAEKTVKTMEDTAHRQLRAYLNVSEAGIKTVDGIMTAHVIIKNFGQTPAYRVVQWVGIVGTNVEDLSPQFTNPGDSIDQSCGVIGPGSTREFKIPLLDKITPQKIVSLKEEKAVIYVYGEISYLDTFNICHTTKYRLFHKGDAVGTSRLAETNEGNEAT